MKSLYIIISLFFINNPCPSSSSNSSFEYGEDIYLSASSNVNGVTTSKKEIHKKTCTLKNCDTDCKAKSRDLLIAFLSKKQEDIKNQITVTAKEIEETRVFLDKKEK
jgi:peptide subunit release factor 1 (eRF1)